jgi:chromosome transmission fidelity protein 18
LQDCFTAYPNQPIQDDNFLSKPNSAYDWLHFYDALSSKVSSSQEWELAPYLSSPVLAFHHLFATSATAKSSYIANASKQAGDDAIPPFSGPSAPFAVSESSKANTAAITSLRSGLSLPLGRMYRSHASLSTELLPYALRLLAPEVKPIVINTSSGNGKSAPTASVRRADEKERLARAVECMAATGVRFNRTRVDSDGPRSNGTWVYRMEPQLDTLGVFDTLGSKAEPVRFAVRQLLEGEWRKREAQKNITSEPKPEAVKTKKTKPINITTSTKDFFGREVEATEQSIAAAAAIVLQNDRIWVKFHEGFSIAVRRPVTLKELLQGF